MSESRQLPTWIEQFKSAGAKADFEITGGNAVPICPLVYRSCSFVHSDRPCDIVIHQCRWRADDLALGWIDARQGGISEPYRKDRSARHGTRRGLHRSGEPESGVRVAVSVEAKVSGQSDVTTARAPRTVTFVNKSGKKIWIGSVVNRGEPDGDSISFSDLPVLAPGRSATVRIPESRASARPVLRPNGMRRQVWFHSPLRSRGLRALRAPLHDGQQPVSLAEFTFDKADAHASWYDVSHVDGFSLPITIAPKSAAHPTPNGPCSDLGRARNLLRYCPAGNKVRSRAGKVVLCVNPSRDTPSNYSRAITRHCPKAYARSKQDQIPGNHTNRQSASSATASPSPSPSTAHR